MISKIDLIAVYVSSGWQELREGPKGIWQKVHTGTKILSPNICYFVEILGFAAIYALFLGDFGQKMCFILSKKVILGQELH